MKFLILELKKCFMIKKTEESAAEREEHEGQGLKILTPQQILSRLPIFLAQLKAGNHSKRL